MNRTEKEDFVNDFHDRITRSKLLLITDFIGLDVAAMNELRSRLRSRSVEMQVVKNNLVKLAGKETPLEQLEDVFVGPNAVVFSYDEDPVEPTKILADFAKSHPQLALKAGILDGKALDRTAIESLARLPGKDVLRAQLLGVLQAPARNMVCLMAAVPRALLYVLRARADKDDQAA